MREIKFRAWDKSDKWMKTDFAVFADGRGAGANHPCSSLCDETYEDYVVMQYTGIKDKNGKGIYEGDIIYDGHGRHEVFFSNGSFCTYIDDGMWLELSQNSFNEEFEVIGNIYENPKLLSPIIK